MDRWLRLILTFLKGLSSSRIQKLEDPFRCEMRVWRTEIDRTLVNNSVYMLYLECARVEMLTSTGLANACRKGRFMPIVRAGSIRYLRPLKRGDKFTVKSQIIGTTSHCIYVKHEIIRGETICVEALATVGFVKTGGMVATTEILGMISSAANFDDKHELVQAWLTFEGLYRKRTTIVDKNTG